MTAKEQIKHIHSWVSSFYFDTIRDKMKLQGKIDKQIIKAWQKDKDEIEELREKNAELQIEYSTAVCGWETEGMKAGRLEDKVKELEKEILNLKSENLELEETANYFRNENLVLESEIKKSVWTLDKQMKLEQQKKCNHNWLNTSFDQMGFALDQICLECGLKRELN